MASRPFHRIFTAVAALSTCLGTVPVFADDSNALEQAFRDPPASARPRVWWHWLNGNITKDGIHKDLEWMKSVGIGGVQTFDVNFSTPTVVDHRLLYMTPEWKDAFRYAASETSRLGLELTIAASPGWSETGGPWVQPADGMKKLVWSVTDIPEGAPFDGKLAAPPQVTGPFQSIPLTAEPGAGKAAVPSYYADVAVLAYPIHPVRTLPTPQIVAADGTTLDASLLADGQYTKTVRLPPTSEGSGQTLTISYPSPQTVQSLNLFGNGNTDMFNGATVKAMLEAETSPGAWTRVTEFSPSLVPTTVSFAPVTASRFRLQLTPVQTLSVMDTISAPGYAGVNYSAFLAKRPLELAEFNLMPQAQVNAFEQKAGFATARDYYAQNGSGDPQTVGVAPGSVIDLTNKLRPDGTLSWAPPKGDWRVLRLGYALTGKTNHPAPQEATGLEVDKMDGRAVRAYMDRYLDTYRTTVGPELLGPRGINAILTDSTEVGSFNWTPAMLEQFRRLRGYDAKSWLPALTGEIVGSRAQSDRFLYDYRRTIADLHAREHYGTLAKVAHENGLKVYGEALEGWRVSLGDDLDMRRYTDVPMAAMWTFPRETGPRPLLIADLRTAAATAHLLGKPFVAAESMTSSRFPWAYGPADLRRVVDLEFAQGVNRIIVHTSPHQPVDDKKPGLSLRHIGQFFDRHESWAGMAGAWVDYIARSSLMLQQGKFVADVAYFIGEEAPAGTLSMDGYFGDVPEHNGYDLVNATAVTELLKVEDGTLVSPGGARYRLLYLAGTSKRMTVPVLRRIAQLVQAGATVVGEAPVSSPSLADDPKEFTRLTKQLWRGKPVTKLGKGRVIAGKDLPAALSLTGVAPDFVAAGSNGGDASGVDFVHRKLHDGDIYFVRNPKNEATSIEARFGISGKTPQVWKADTGKIQPVSYRMAAGHTIVPLKFEAEESYFIVFRDHADASTKVLPEPSWRPVTALGGPWTVSFEPDRGAPAQIAMKSLIPLGESTEPGVKYFSGVATYRTSFQAPAGLSQATPLMLDLGTIGDLAQVSINGRPLGTVWHPPYRIDVSGFVKPGANMLEVKVANLWVNRLVGDAQPSAQKIGWTANAMYRADAPLRPSGLIGPVQLIEGIAE